MKLISVNDVIRNSKSLLGSEVFLHGALTSIDGNILITHWPKSERELRGYKQIWIFTGEGAFSFNHEVIRRINDKRVVVHGTIVPNKTVWADDPGSYWEVHLLATELTEYKIWNESHGDDQI